jgi:uncharacterized protein YqjF (DUF2071 family)
MVNYFIDPQILKHLIPNKTELDFWNGRCYVSLVGFMFLNTRLKGIAIPFHSNFEEVNLRFYVRYKEREEWKRGVVFIKEIVPKLALSIIANLVYGEKYETMRMDHVWDRSHNRLKIEYSWKKKGTHAVSVLADSTAIDMHAGSEEEFITEHFWGYTKINENATSEYQVEHPRWKVYPVTEYTIDVDFGLIYGPEFAFLNTEKPASAFLAEGSEIIVRSGIKIS